MTNEVTYARSKDSNCNGAWFSNNTKKAPNDVHVYAMGTSLVLGHNTQDLNACGGTPLALVLDTEEASPRLQYKVSETSVDNVAVDPVVFAKHFLEFLTKVRDETLAKPYKAPEKAVELKE